MLNLAYTNSEWPIYEWDIIWNNEPWFEGTCWGTHAFHSELVDLDFGNKCLLITHRDYEFREKIISVEKK